MRSRGVLSLGLLLALLILWVGQADQVCGDKYQPIKVADRFKPVMNYDDDDDVDDWDISEDLVVDAPTPKAKQPKIPSKPKTEELDAKPAEEQKLTESGNEPLAVKYAYEIVGVIVAILYGVNYLYGKGQNDQIVTKWFEKFGSTFKQQFHFVDLIEKESESLFVLYTTGRTKVHYVYVTLELKRRYDLFSVLKDLIFPTHDRICIHATFSPEALGQYVLCLIPTRDRKEFVSSNDDIKRFTRIDRPYSGSEKFTIKSEHEEPIQQLLNNSITGRISASLDLFESIHVTDHAFIKLLEETHVLKQARFIFKLPSAAKMDRLEPLMSIFFDYLDMVPQVQLSSHSLGKAEESRRLYKQEKEKAEHAKRQENAQRLKQEKKKKEEEEIAKRSPEEQRKWEEKEHKKQLKKNMKQRVITM